MRYLFEVDLEVDEAYVKNMERAAEILRQRMEVALEGLYTKDNLVIDHEVEYVRSEV